MTGTTEIATQADTAKSLAVAIFLADQNPHRDRSRGITGMTRGLLDQLKTRAELKLIPVISKSSFRDDDLKQQSLLIPWRTDQMFGRLFSDALHPFLARAKADVWYYPKGYVSLLGKPRVPTVGTMHDTIIQHYADHYADTRPQRDLNYWIRVTKRSLRNLKLVLTVSNHAKDQLIRFCDRYQINPPAIAVTYESSDWEAYIGLQFDKADYAVHLASDAPHKKTNRLLELWLELQSRSTDLPPLKLVGSLDATGLALLDQIRHAELVQHMSREQLVSVIGRARVLLLPSEIEGFGLPALEAYYVSTPVCYVRDTAVDEVVGPLGANGGFQLNSSESLISALNDVLGLPVAEVQHIRDNMFNRFARHSVADEVVRQLFRAAGRKYESPISAKIVGEGDTLTSPLSPASSK